MHVMGRAFLSLLSVVSFASGGFAGVPVQAESVLIYLEAGDCQKCHEQELRDIESRGGLHKTAVTCLDCHVEHPPRGTEAIPECTRCHEPEKNSHYTVGDCRGCHPAHRPRDIEFTGTARVTPACASCHPHQGQQLEDYPSAHTLLDCTECHSRHGAFYKCQECHDPHTPDMVYEDCLGCHKPHMPSRVAYDNFVPSRFCAGCHPAQTEQLAQSSTKHRDLLCVYCHKDQHKRIPQCVTCHRMPHNQAFHEKFPDCNACHGGPHALQK
jgi:hypothetical protein